MWAPEGKGKRMPVSVMILAFCKKGDSLDEEIERYRKLIAPFASVSVSYLRSPGTSSFPKNDLLEAEGKIVTARIPGGSLCVALSEEGTSLPSSRAFAQWLSKKTQDCRVLTFILGGAYGLSPRVKAASEDVISLSPLTFAHKLAVVVLLEQIYRAFTILKNHPYHK